MHVCMYVCMHVCMYVCHVCIVCMYVCMSVCSYAIMYVCMYVCKHVCMCIVMPNNIHACMQKAFDARFYMEGVRRLRISELGVWALVSSQYGLGFRA